jgi:hypothetical protein
MGDLLDPLNGPRVPARRRAQLPGVRTKVGDVKVAYDRTNFDEIADPTCLKRVAVPLERALRIYAKARETQTGCVEDIYCENDSVTPQLQEQWLKADGAVTRASAGLRLEVAKRDDARRRARVQSLVPPSQDRGTGATNPAHRRALILLSSSRLTREVAGPNPAAPIGGFRSTGGVGAIQPFEIPRVRAGRIRSAGADASM